MVLTFGLAAGGAARWSAEARARQAREARAAVLQLADSDFAAAEAGLLRAHEQHPDDAEVVAALARGYAATDPGRAETYFARWAALAPDDPEALRTWFEFARKHKHRDEALAAGRHLLPLEPQNRTLRGALMALAYETGELAEAEGYCRTLLADQPRSLELRLFLARVRREREDTAGAAAILDQLLAENPRNTAALLARGTLYRETGEPHKAIAPLREVLRLDPTRQRKAGYELGLALEMTGDTEAARQVMIEVRRRQDVEVFHDAVMSQPDNFDLHVRLAEQLLADGHTDDGLALLNTVLQRDPGFPPAHRALAAYYDRIHQPDTAARHRRAAEPR